MVAYICRSALCLPSDLNDAGLHSSSNEVRAGSTPDAESFQSGGVTRLLWRPVGLCLQFDSVV